MRDNYLIGVTVLPEYIQSEGIDHVLDNLVKRAGANAVATSPYVMEEGDEATGAREPPIDAGAGSVRLLDRPLWGKRELWVKTAPSFVPDKQLYEGLRYQPAEPTELTRRQGSVIHQFIEAAHARGLKVYFQVQAVIPPGYRVQFGGPVDDDAPRMPSGQIPARRVDNNGCLASPHIVNYSHALIRDLCSQYPQVNGIRFDWPEYPPYLLDCVFVDFCEHVENAARDLDGFDFDAMRRDSGKLYDMLNGGLTNELVEAFTESASDPDQWSAALAEHFPGAAAMIQLKATLSDRLLSGFRDVMKSIAPQMELAPSAFPPPWSIVSGMDFGRAARHCDALSVKLYGMHWAMMLRFYGDQLRAANPGLSPQLLARMLVRLLDIADDDGLPSLDDYQYPAPNEPHPIGRKSQIRKIETAQRQAGDTPIHAFAHGYGPLDDFRQRIEVATEASQHGIWVNRYAYLSDEKLDAIGHVT